MRRINGALPDVNGPGRLTPRHATTGPVAALRPHSRVLTDVEIPYRAGPRAPWRALGLPGPPGPQHNGEQSVAELLTRVADIRTAQDRAAVVHDQAIRDAATAGHPLTSIASTLVRHQPQRLYTVLGKPRADHPRPTPGTRRPPSRHQGRRPTSQ
jgi:hypothetical protein